MDAEARVGQRVLLPLELERDALRARRPGPEGRTARRHGMRAQRALPGIGGRSASSVGPARSARKANLRTARGSLADRAAAWHIGGREASDGRARGAVGGCVRAAGERARTTAARRSRPPGALNRFYNGQTNTHIGHARPRARRLRLRVHARLPPRRAAAAAGTRSTAASPAARTTSCRSTPAARAGRRSGATASPTTRRRTGVDTVAVYRCVRPAIDHFFSPDPGCEGYATEGRMGFLPRRADALVRSYNGRDEPPRRDGGADAAAASATSPRWASC